MRRATAAALTGMLLAGAAQAQEVPLTALGDLDIAYSSVQATDRIPGAPLRGVIRARAGDAYRMQLPRAAQRAVFQITSGTAVEAGEAVVRLEGPEIHHWLLEYNAIEDRYDSARARYEANRGLYEDGALPAERWAAIQDRYYELGLEYEHMQHFGDLVVGDAAAEDALLLGSPRAGIAVFDSRISTFPEGAEVFRVMEANTLRLQVEAPAAHSDGLHSLRVDDCTLAVDIVDRSARNFFFAAWSEPLSDACSWPPGTILSARPLYARDALIVPRTALFQWQQSPHVFLRDGDQLRATPVEPVADVAGGYAIAASEALAGREVLSASVSAVQGILLGLGRN